MKKIEYRCHDRFEKQLKKLIKKYRSLGEDLEIAKKYAIEAFHISGINNESVWLVPKFDKKTVQIYKLHVDHIMPWSKGGKTTFENLHTLCADCNIGRGNRYSE